MDFIMDLNPLLIPHILETIFDHLSVFNLKKCRLICKLWHNEATSFLQKRSRISFSSVFEIDRIISLKSSPEVSSICTTFDFGHEVDLKSSSVLEFFHKFGGRITALDLSFHHDFGPTWIQQVFPTLSSIEELCINGRALFLHQDTTLGDLELPFTKLRFLFIYDSTFEEFGEDRMSVWITNVFYILLSSPGLERVFYAPFLESRAKKFFSLITSEALVHPKLSHLHINHLTFTSSNQSHFASLLKKKFPLKYVHLVLTPRTARTELNYFLHEIRNTLRELTLTFSDGSSCEDFHPIEPISNVTKLSIIGYEGMVMASSSPNLELFVMSLPEGEEEEDSETLIRNGMKDLNKELKELEIYDSKVKYSIPILRVIFTQFSNLVSLKMNNVDNAMLRLIYQTLPNLHQLCICFHKFFGVNSLPIDAGLCGIPEFRMDQSLLNCMDMRDVEHLRTYGWIGGMKKLRVLELELGQITDYGVVLGIARCSQLTRLLLKNCDRMLDRDPSDDDESMTDISLEAICDLLTNLMYLKLEGYNNCFTKGVIEKARDLAIETHFT